MNALAPVMRPTSSPAAPILRLATRDDELRRLGPAWQELLSRTPSPNPMCAPDWLTTWWKVYGRDRELCVGHFYDGDQLIGVAPLCRRRFQHRFGIGMRRLEFLGSDVDEHDGVCSDYLNLIVQPGSEKRVAEAFVHGLQAGVFGSWDECVLSTMEVGMPLTVSLIDAIRQARISLETTLTVKSPYLALPVTWSDFLHSLSKKKRQSLTYALRDFQAWAGADWSLHVARTEVDRDQGMRILEQLHIRRWQPEAHGGAFAAPRFREFHERFTSLALANRQLQLMWASVHGAPVAAFYGFTANDRVYFYQCGRILGTPPKVRLGIVMLIYAIQYAMEQGMKEFDFLAGEAQYKALFATGDRQLCQVRMARFGLPEVSYRLSQAALRGARRLRHGMRSAANGMHKLLFGTAKEGEAKAPSPDSSVNVR